MAAKGSKKVDQYKELFKKFDTNGSGTLSITELRNMLKSGNSNMSDRQIADTFVFFDGPQGDKEITFEEFTKGLDAIVTFFGAVKQLFTELDADKSGCLDRNELKSLLQRTGKQFSEDEVTQILKEADVNGDNKISLEEFLNACC